MLIIDEIDLKPGKAGEIQITDALSEQAKQGKVVAYKFKGKRFELLLSPDPPLPFQQQ